MNVAEYLTKRNIDFQILPHGDTCEAQRLAHELQTPGREVAKTVLLRADGGYVYYVAIVPATRKIDMERVSAALGGCRLQLATEPDVAAHCPDCERGVLPPFGSQYAMKTIVDQSLASSEEMIFEGSTHREAIRMKVKDFCRLENPLILNIAQ